MCARPCALRCSLRSVATSWRRSISLWSAVAMLDRGNRSIALLIISNREGRIFNPVFVRIGRPNDVRTCLQEGFEFLGGLASEAWDLRDLFECGEAQTLHAAEFLEERGLASLTDPREFVQYAFRNSFQAKLRIVGVCEAVRFVAHALKEFQRAGVVVEANRLRFPGAINFLKFL